MGWIYLIVGGLFEVGFTSSLKLSENFTRLWPTVSFFVCSFLSLYLLNKALSSISLGTAYAVWTGIGAVGTAIIGMVFFQDPVSFWRILFLATVITGILGLKLVS